MGANKKIPMRQCVGCQEMKNKKEMIRVIRTSEGEFLLDATGRKNGRGAYICPNQECLKKAVKSKGLERSFKQAIPQEVYFYKDKDTLGHAMGKEFRASLAILDEGFAKEIMKQMKTEDNTVA